MIKTSISYFRSNLFHMLCCRILLETNLNSLLFYFRKYFLFRKQKVLLIERTNQPLVFYGQPTLFLAYVLSIKHIPDICFVHNHYAGHLIWFLAYILSTKPISGIGFGHSYYAGHFIRIILTYSCIRFVNKTYFLAYVLFILFTVTMLATS